ncbi:hypothetical protein AWB74_06242 [Caballeronia arvi]|uniref:Lipoprotein n=1 Tax=Caballeronia arvi TaxID=1777135 RepID=A0A158KMJ4_9BURK|nr:hypothetical protein [Caballeronia arvi]SAL82357.1 hypothetical protein AWB74_06242 [Caballeronia arvi]
MKTYLALLTAVALAACGGGGSNDGGAKTTAQSSPASEAPSASTPAATTPAADSPAASTPATTSPSITPTNTPNTPASTPDTPASSTPVTADPGTPASNPSGASAPGGASRPAASACTSGFTTDVTAACWNGNNHNIYVYEIPKTVIAANTIIRENTTWTAENSPYYVPSGIQIAANATLTIEAGAVVEGDRITGCATCTGEGGQQIGATPITNAGVVKVQGSSAAHAKLYGFGVSNTQSGSVSIQYADLYETPLPTGSTNKLVLLDSRVERASVTEDMTNGVRSLRSYGVNLGQNSDVERNTFINSAGLLFDTTSTIKNNLFVDMVSPLTITSAAMVWTPDTTGGSGTTSYAPTAVTLNSFLFKTGSTNANRIAVTMYSGVGCSVAASTAAGSTCTPFVLDVSNSYWGTTNNTIIASRVVDKNSNVNLNGEIKYTPALEKPDAATPVDNTGLTND